MTKTISFAQEGQTLRLYSDAPVQYSDEIAVEINLDTDYVQATDVVLITQPEGRHAKPARSTLTISGQVAQGTIKRRQLMQDGTTLFVLAGKIGDAILPTAACYVQVQRSVDPQAESYVDDPETLVDVISKSVTITNKSLRKDDVSSVYKTLDILSQYYTYPASFVAAPIVSCRYTPASDRLHIGIYGSQDDNRAAAEDDGTYKTPPYFYLCSPVSSSQTLSGVADLVVEGRWK